MECKEYFHTYLHKDLFCIWAHFANFEFKIRKYIYKFLKSWKYIVWNNSELQYLKKRASCRFWIFPTFFKGFLLRGYLNNHHKMMDCLFKSCVLKKTSQIMRFWNFYIWDPIFETKKYCKLPRLHVKDNRFFFSFIILAILLLDYP